MTAHHTPANPIVPGDLFARHQTITGLRALADFLENNPAVPVDEYGQDYTLYTHTLGDTCGLAEVDRIAALLAETVRDDTPRGGHYWVAKTFGRVTYRALHIPSRAMADHDARTSYRNNITLDDQPAAKGQAA
jgi:hypothetical protein